MLLFTKNLEKDYEFMLEGYQDGIITDQRLDEALTRILALKTKLRILEGAKEIEHPENNFINFEHKNIAKQIASNGIALVKSNQNILPLKTLKIL